MPETDTLSSAETDARTGTDAASRPRLTLLRHHLLAPAVSCFLGVLSLATVLCFHFPEALTTREFRAVYSENFARALLLIGLAAAFFAGTISVLRDQHKTMAFVGVGTATVAVLLGGTQVPFDGPVEHTRFALGLDWFVLALFFSALVFIPLEHAFARRPVPVFRPGWRTDACYFFMSHVLVQLILILVTASTSLVVESVKVPGLQAWITDLPFVVAFVMAVFLADLAQAVLHRCYHRIMVLWRFHAVHHSSPELDWLAGSRVHFVETVLTRSIVLLPLLLVGFSPTVVNAYAVLVGIQAVLAHANVGIRFGVLEYLIVLPRYHHWHHARHRDYWDRNYAIHLPVVDMLMGSFKLPRDGSWPEEYGVLKPETVPVGILAQHIAPFRGQRTYEDHVR